MKTFSLASIPFAIIVIVFAVMLFDYHTQPAYGSIVQGNEYFSTTTYAAATPVRTLKAAGGALAQVTVTGANTGLITLYDATTSDVTKRAMATSALQVLADFPASAAAGTYTFDATFNNGLLLSGTGALATSTITYR